MHVCIWICCFYDTVGYNITLTEGDGGGEEEFLVAISRWVENEASTEVNTFM